MRHVEQAGEIITLEIGNGQSDNILTSNPFHSMQILDMGMVVSEQDILPRSCFDHVFLCPVLIR